MSRPENIQGNPQMRTPAKQLSTKQWVVKVFGRWYKDNNGAAWGIEPPAKHSDKFLQDWVKDVYTPWYNALPPTTQDSNPGDKPPPPPIGGGQPLAGLGVAEMGIPPEGIQVGLPGENTGTEAGENTGTEAGENTGTEAGEKTE